MQFIEHIHYSREIENAILGACLLEKEAFARTFGIIEKDNFYYSQNKAIYEVLCEMYAEGLPIDNLTVNSFLFNNKRIFEIEGNSIPWILVEISKSVVSSAHLEYHCLVLNRMWMEREVINLTHGGVELEGDAKDKIEQITKRIEKLNSGHVVSDWANMGELLYDLTRHQEEMTKNKGKGIELGLKKVDELTGGLFPGNFMILGARPSVGKSAFMNQMLVGQAKKGFKVGVISLEMNNNEIAARLSAVSSGIDFKAIFRNLFIDQEQSNAWHENTRSLANLPIYVSDNTKVNAADIRAKAQKLKYQKGLDILYIDYLQLVNSNGTNRNATRENEVSKISRELKLMAKDVGIPVVVLAQLNRAVTHRTGTNRYPQLSDLRESGSLEQDADIVCFLHRDWMTGDEKYMVNENGQSTENEADFIVRKWRNGPANLQVKLNFDGSTMRFKQTEEMNFIRPEIEVPASFYEQNKKDDLPF